MPEGPEIRRAADRLHKVLTGNTLHNVFFYHPHLHNYQGALTGSRVTSVTSASKALLTSFDCGLSLYTHNQLYGRWYICKQGKRPSTGRSLRVALETDKASALLYSASDIEVLPSSDTAAHPYLAKLGPEALDETTTTSDIVGQLNDNRFHRRGLASLLLDQSFVAGLGNYLRSEILYFAGIYPAHKPKDLNPEQLTRLGQTILDVTRQAYRTAGITNLEARVDELKRQGLRRQQFRFAVFARAGKPCYVCKTHIERKQMHSRRIYICPGCQPAP